MATDSPMVASDDRQLYNSEILWAEHLISHGQYPEAARILEKMLAADPANLNIIINLGVNACQLGQLESAEIFFQTAVALDNKNLIAMSNLALIQFKRYRFEKALGTFEKVMQMDGDNSTWHSMIEICHKNKNKTSAVTGHTSNSFQIDEPLPAVQTDMHGPEQEMIESGISFRSTMGSSTRSAVNEDHNPARLTVIINAYSLSENILKIAVDSLRHTTPQEYVTIRIVNAGPPIDPPSFLAGIEVIGVHPADEHFAKTFNDAIQTSAAEWVLLSDDQVEFQTGWFNVWNQCVGAGYELIGCGCNTFSVKKSTWQKVGGLGGYDIFNSIAAADFLVRCVADNVRMSHDFGPIDFDCRMYAYFTQFNAAQHKEPDGFAGGNMGNECRWESDYISSNIGQKNPSCSERLLDAIPHYKHRWRFKNASTLLTSAAGIR